MDGLGVAIPSITGAEGPSCNDFALGSIFYSREGIVEAKLHRHLKRAVDWGQQPELHAVAVVSGCENHKDMGGLLMKDGRDFLIYLTSGRDTDALAGSRKLGRNVRVIRRIKGDNPLQPRPSHSQYVYIYCGLYEVTDSWQIAASKASSSYFRMMRVPGQAGLKPQQMFFKSVRSAAAHSFSMTWKAYAQLLHKDPSVPCEQVNPLEHTGISPQLDAELDSYDLCDVCGIDGNDIPMTRCGCCLQNSQETVACLGCIPKDHVEWIQGDQDKRHWRCRRCR
ncbi:Histone-lysine N-methyltransferase member suvh2, variant 2 [Trebouxia sp. C0010 RCD-2024]